MGIAIRATAVSTDPAVGGSIEHASISAGECMDAAGLSAEQIDLLINTGVYRDSNMSEPAMAAMIQRNVGVSLDYVKYPTGRPALSFDLMNGACGVLNAVQVGGAFVEGGGSEYVLVVSGDAHPSGGPAPEDFPYASLGAAMLLERTAEPGAGFGRVHTALAPGSPAVAGFTDTATMGVSGRDLVTVERDADAGERLLDLAARTVTEYAASEGFTLAGTLLLTGPALASGLAARLGLPADQVATADGAAAGAEGDPHTSAPILAYRQALADGRAEACERLLFVAAGAGPSCACAVYRLPCRP